MNILHQHCFPVSCKLINKTYVHIHWYKNMSMLKFLKGNEIKNYLNIFKIFN